MIFTDLLWLLVWGGMFTGIYNLRLAGGWSDPLSVFQAVRTLFPLAAAYLSLIWMLVKRPGFSFLRMPASFLFGYFAVSAVSSVFLSPNRLTALYWAGEYVAPLLVVWVAVETPDPLDKLRRILYLNNIIVAVIFFALIPDVLRVGGSDELFTQIYKLPFNLGDMRANGVGRFALVMVIISFTYLICRRRKRDKIAWAVLLLPALFMLAQTRSRTSLLGLAISGVLLVLILGVDLRFLVIAPAATYLVYLSGIKWRLQGHVERLMFLTGRDYTWRKGLTQIEHSPFLGWGFHADRLMLNSEHMHNSYLHSAIHSGLFGAALFTAAIVAIWQLHPAIGAHEEDPVSLGAGSPVAHAIGPDHRLPDRPELLRIDGGLLRGRSPAPRPGHGLYLGLESANRRRSRRDRRSLERRASRSPDMKISIHTMYFLPDFGSAPILINELATDLAARGHEVEVVTTIPRRRPAELKGRLLSRRRENGFLVKRFWTNAGAASDRPAPRLEHLYGGDHPQCLDAPERGYPLPAHAAAPARPHGIPGREAPGRQSAPQRPGHPSRSLHRIGHPQESAPPSASPRPSRSGSTGSPTISSSSATAS